MARSFSVPTNVAPRTTGTVVPHDGGRPEDLLPYVPDAITFNRKDWCSLRVPASSPFQEGYGKIVVPIRALCLFTLFISYAWWRVAILWLIIGTLAALVWIAVGV